MKPESRGIYFSQCWFRKVLKALPGFCFPTLEFRLWLFEFFLMPDRSQCCQAHSQHREAGGGGETRGRQRQTERQRQTDRHIAFRNVGFMLGSHPSQASHCSWNGTSPLGWIKQKPHLHQNPLWNVQSEIRWADPQIVLKIFSTKGCTSKQTFITSIQYLCASSRFNSCIYWVRLKHNLGNTAVGNNELPLY